MIMSQTLYVLAYKPIILLVLYCVNRKLRFMYDIATHLKNHNFKKNDVQPKKRRKRKRRRAKASSQVAMSKTNHTESSLSAKPSRDSLKPPALNVMHNIILMRTLF